MERDQFTFYKSFWDAIRGLPKKARQDALEAVIEYAIYEKAPSLSGVPFSVFTLIRPTLDSSRNKAKNRTNKTKTKEEQNSNEGEKESKSKGESKRENECYIESANADSCAGPESKEAKKPDKPPTRARFTPPTVEEVRVYCLECSYTAVDPERFVNFYQSKGWKVGKESMKDWKAAVRGWATRDKSEPKGGYYQKKQPVPMGCSGLGDAELEAIQRVLNDPTLDSSV